MKPSNKLIIESLSDDWCDKDYVMLHACFQLLKDCIENENLFTGEIDWVASKRHKEAKVELNLLYEWWIERLKTVDDGMSMESQYAEDNIMLHRLIEIRWAMWT